MRLILLILLIMAACDDSGPDKENTLLSSENTSVEISHDNNAVDVEDGASITFTEEFLELVNTHRISLGIKPLIHVEGLEDIAQTHSQNMASGSVAFGHDGFSERCSDGRIILSGGNLCGENVAKGQKTPKAAYQSWMNSSGHRANIEQSRYTHTGFGFAQDKSGTYYWTQIFFEMK